MRSDKAHESPIAYGLVDTRPTGDDQGINRLPAHGIKRLGDEAQPRGRGHLPSSAGYKGEAVGSRGITKDLELAGCRERLQRPCDVEQLYPIKRHDDDVARSGSRHRLLRLAEFASTLSFLPSVVSGKMAAIANGGRNAVSHRFRSVPSPDPARPDWSLRSFMPHA